MFNRACKGSEVHFLVRKEGWRNPLSLDQLVPTLLCVSPLISRAFSNDLSYRASNPSTTHFKRKIGLDLLNHS